MSLIEPLEVRRLLSGGFAAHIHFQPAPAPAPTGYLVDAGALFGDRGNGLSYGWNGRRPAQVLLRHPHKPIAGLDDPHDSFAVINARGRGSLWQIVVPNGTYQVDVTAGDPTATAARYRILVDGVLVVNGRATRAQRWVSGSEQITVTEGLIALSVPRGTSSKIDFIDIVQIVPAMMPSPPPPPAPPPPPSPPPPPPVNGLTQPLVWQTRASAPEGLVEAQSTAVNGKLYVFGGYNVSMPDYQATTRAEVFDPSSNTWSALANMPVPETHMGVANDGQYIYVAGGYTYDPRTTYQTFGTTNVFRYDIATNTWTTVVPLPAPRAAGALVYLNGELHFFDGIDPSRAGQTEHWVLNPGAAQPQWADLTPLPFSRNHTVGAVLNGKIYAIGGQPGDNDSDTSADVLLWDPSNPSVWTPVASLPSPRSHAVVGVIDDRIVVAGGTTTNDLPISSVVVYDPDANTWTAQTPLPGPRLAPTGAVVGNQIIVTTGYDNGFQSTTFMTTVGG